MTINNPDAIRGCVFHVQRFSLNDGPGIRTLVFLKGCPLRCLWCDNPESINPNPELGFSRACCDKCGKCVLVCPEQAISCDTPDGFPRIERKRCTACGECVKVCAPEALAIYGEERSAADVLEEVKRDVIFYRSSNGGMTVSGGELLVQSSFAIALLKLCREAGISTAIETSGYGDWAVLQEVLKHTDLAFYDIKCFDDQEHRRLTGRGNDLILANARKLVASGIKHQFRLPLVPGLTDGAEKIEATARFLRDLEGAEASIELMPYHRLGVGKYEALAWSYSIAELESCKPESYEAARKMFEERGVKCLVSM